MEFRYNKCNFIYSQPKRSQTVPAEESGVMNCYIEILGFSTKEIIDIIQVSP